MIWIPVTERMPPEQQPVFAAYRGPSGAWYRVRATYYGRWQLPLDIDQEMDGVEYTEDSGEGFCPAGWYETNENEETHWLITSPVTYWMPLPPAPMVSA